MPERLRDKPRVLVVADAGSPIAQNWIRCLVAGGSEVHVVSSHPSRPDSVSGAASFHVVPIGLSWLSRSGGGASSGGSARRGLLKTVVSEARKRVPVTFLGAARDLVAPAELFLHVRALRSIVESVRPDLVHAMRIPYEGMLAAEALQGSRVPLVVSVWGNDFTLHARSSRTIRILTQRALARTSALHVDCERDGRIAPEFGFSSHAPIFQAPGNLGLDTSFFSTGASDNGLRSELGLEPRHRVVFNPRGVRSYVRTDVFLRAIPRVLAQVPDAAFVCLGLAGNAPLERLIDELGIRSAVRLTSTMPRARVRDIFRIAELSVSPSLHDGTPNTLLEAMACGSFPVAGDIESVREWIRSGENGLLFDPRSPDACAEAMIRALRDDRLRADSKQRNAQLIAERADEKTVLPRVEDFYRRVAFGAA